MILGGIIAILCCAFIALLMIRVSGYGDATFMWACLILVVIAAYPAVYVMIVLRAIMAIN